MTVAKPSGRRATQGRQTGRWWKVADKRTLEPNQDAVPCARERGVASRVRGKRLVARAQPSVAAAAVGSGDRRELPQRLRFFRRNRRFSRYFPKYWAERSTAHSRKSLILNILWFLEQALAKGCSKKALEPGF